jgi:hypothetical protein
VQFGHGSAGIVQAGHEDKPESFGLVRFGVGRNLDVLDFSKALEEVKEIAFRAVERKIPHVNPRGHDALWRRWAYVHGTGFPRGACLAGLRRTLLTGRAWLAGLLSV